MAPLTFQVFSIVHHSVGQLKFTKVWRVWTPNTRKSLFSRSCEYAEDANRSLNEMTEEDINSLVGGEVILKWVKLNGLLLAKILYYLSS